MIKTDDHRINIRKGFFLSVFEQSMYTAMFIILYTWINTVQQAHKLKIFKVLLEKMDENSNMRRGMVNKLKCQDGNTFF